MIDLQKIMSEEIQRLEDSGELDKLIREEVSNTIKDVLKSSISSYKLRRSIEDALKDNLSGLAAQLGIESYANAITDIMREALKAKFDDITSNAITKVIDEVCVQHKDQDSLSCIINKYKEWVNDDDDDEKRDANDNHDGFKCYLKNNYKSGGTFKVYTLHLDRYNDEDDDSSDIIIKFKNYFSSTASCDGESVIEEVKIDGHQLSRRFIPQNLTSFEKMLVNYMFNQTKIIMDVSNYDEDDHYYETQEDY